MLQLVSQHFSNRTVGYTRAAVLHATCVVTLLGDRLQRKMLRAIALLRSHTYFARLRKINGSFAATVTVTVPNPRV